MWPFGQTVAERAGGRTSNLMEPESEREREEREREEEGNAPTHNNQMRVVREMGLAV